ncbi:hypothetical protein HYW54_05520 [Candidatus Gottesmanbacteria bacterium]|nr:hypothetical protein [Candidatus Gottesmanbacteria bacterium]
MQTITMTELRIRPKELLKTLREGKAVDLIHRSKPVATIQPKPTQPKKFNAKKFKETVDRLGFPYLTDRDIEKRYRKAMMKKHGKALL